MVMVEVTLNDIISQGEAKLRKALSQGRVTLDRVYAEQARDIETVRVREYWGDRDDEQRLITQGIKLRIAARKTYLRRGVPLMRDLIETTITYTVALLLIGATYYAFSHVLSGLVEQAFANLTIAVQ